MNNQQQKIKELEEKIQNIMETLDYLDEQWAEYNHDLEKYQAEYKNLTNKEL